MNTRDQQRRQARSPPVCRRRPWALPLLTLTLAAGLVGGGLAWAFQATSGDPLALHPDPKQKGAPARLEIGEVLLLSVLQDFANYTGRTVYAHGDIPPTTSIKLTRRVKDLNQQTAGALLKKHGYVLSEDDIRGKRVFWVQKRLVRKQTRGKLSRATADRPGAERETRDHGARRDRGERAEGASLCLYRRQDGNGTRFVVLFETDSEEAADDALSLLQAHQRSRQ